MLQKCHKLNIKGDLVLFLGGWPEAISYEGYCFRFMLTAFQLHFAVLLKEATIRHYCPQKKVNFIVHTFIVKKGTLNAIVFLIRTLLRKLLSS